MNPQGFPLRRSSSCHWVHTSTTLLCSTCERSVSASFLFLFSPSWASQTLQGSPTRELRSQANIPGCLSSEAVKRKGDFVFQTGHVIEIVTKLFLVVQNATGKPPTVNINTQFDANFGTHSVTFQFKASIIFRVFFVVSVKTIGDILVWMSWLQHWLNQNGERPWKWAEHFEMGFTVLVPADKTIPVAQSKSRKIKARTPGIVSKWWWNKPIQPSG